MEGFMQMKKVCLSLMAIACSSIVTVPAASAFDFMKTLQDIAGDASSSSSLSNSTVSALSSSDMVAGLKDALRVGSERVVSQLGKADGFNSDAKIHIPLPDSMQRVKSALAAVGMGGAMDDLELKLNRAAETATPKAKKIFGNAIKDMSIADAKGILSGPNDAATRYFEKKMTPALRAEMTPVIENSMAQVGAVQAYDTAMQQYKSLPFVPDVKANLTEHVLDRGLKGIFLYLASEEAAIRKDPMKRHDKYFEKSIC